MTSSKIERAWAAYAAAEDDRIRPTSLARLSELIEALSSVPESERNAWARHLARQLEAKELKTPIRMPLFRKVLFPALLAGLKSGTPDCARWLAGFSHLLCQSVDCQNQLQPGQRGEIGLLNAALRLNPNDELARSAQIKAIRQQLEYSIHEVPAGVLWDHNGATIEQCGELLDEVLELERLVLAHGTGAEHSALISECKLHYEAYPRYLARRSEFSSYAEFLARVEPPTKAVNLDGESEVPGD